jgi:6-phosphogluconolactonase (cycloisomerase 2 family)
MFIAGCGMYQIDGSTGALSQVAKDPEAPNDGWSSFDPTSSFVWIVTSQQPCFDCEEGVDAYQVDPTSGAMTLVPNSFFAMTNSQVGGIQALAITH